MNRKELIAAIAKDAGLSQKEASKALDAFCRTVTAELIVGNRVQCLHFGTFCVKERSARVAKNPVTGERINVPASKAPVFKAGKELKSAVNK